jgi:hypothetical protein
MRLTRALTAAIALALTTTAGWAADKKKDEAPKWDVRGAWQDQADRVHDRRRHLDGRGRQPGRQTIVFDLLGDLYLLPIEGGRRSA